MAAGPFLGPFQYPSYPIGYAKFLSQDILLEMSGNWIGRAPIGSGSVRANGLWKLYFLHGTTIIILRKLIYYIFIYLDLLGMFC